MDWIKKRENQIFFSVTIVTILVAICPLITRYCLLGHDSEYHLLRIEALKQQIEMGKPFLKVNPTFFGGAGYASSLFYPDLLLYIPALFRVLGMSINQSYHLFMILCVVLCYAVSYVCGKKITNNRYIGMLFAIILTLSSYHLDDIMVRAAAGEYTAFIFVPIVVYGVYNLCYEDMNKPWILGLGMGLVLLCHTLSFLMCIAMIVIMFVFNFDVFLKKPSLVLKLAATGVLTLFVTISYWLPIVEQFMNDTFYISTPWIEPAQEAVKVSSIFGFSFPTLGIGLLILLLPRVLIFRNHEDSIMKFADQCITTGIIFAVLATDIVPWNRIGKYLSVVQFPWRLYLVSTVLLSIGAAVVVYRLTGAIFLGASDNPEEYDNEVRVITSDSLINKYGVIMGLVLAMMTVITIYTYSNQTREYFDYSNDFYSYKPFTCSVIAGEWLPLAVDNQDDLIESCEHVYDNNGNDIEFIREKNAVVFTLEDSCTYVDAPFVYYKGYAAKTPDMNYLYLDGSGNNGLVRVYPNGYTGEVIVSYEGTIIQKLSEILSLQFMLGIVLIYVTFRRIAKELYG